MTRVRARLELPPDLSVDADEVRGRLSEALHDELCKAERARKLPHKFPQSLVDQSVRQYRKLADQMLDEILDVLTG